MITLIIPDLKAISLAIKVESEMKNLQMLFYGIATISQIGMLLLAV